MTETTPNAYVLTDEDHAAIYSATDPDSPSWVITAAFRQVADRAFVAGQRAALLVVAPLVDYDRADWSSDD